MEQQTRAYLHAATAVFLWSTVASAFKLSLRHLSSVELLLGAALVSLAVLVLMLAVRGRLGEVRAVPPREWGRSALLGFLNPFLYYLVLFRAYELLPAQEAQPLNMTWPIVLVLFSVVFLRQRIGPTSIVALAVSFLGVLVISTRGELATLRITDPTGVACALGSTLIWAAYWTAGVRDPLDPVLRLAMNFLFGAALVAAWALLVEPVRWPSRPGALGATYVGLFEMGITFVVWLQALRLSRSTVQVSILIFLAPFLSLVWIHLLVGEEIFPSTVTGLVLIVAGIGLRHWAEVRAARRRRASPGGIQP